MEQVVTIRTACAAEAGMRSTWTGPAKDHEGELASRAEQERGLQRHRPGKVEQPDGRHQRRLHQYDGQRRGEDGEGVLHQLVEIERHADRQEEDPPARGP